MHIHNKCVQYKSITSNVDQKLISLVFDFKDARDSFTIKR